MAFELKTLGTTDDLSDPNYLPKMAEAVPLGIQHVMAMFVGNLAPVVVICGAAGFGPGSEQTADFIYMIQMAMVFAGLSTLFQTIGVGSVGARLPVVLGTNFAFVPIVLPLVADKGPEAMAIVMGGTVASGLTQALFGTFIVSIRGMIPPLVAGIVMLVIGLTLLPIGIDYAAGGSNLRGTDDYGTPKNWGIAGLVIVVTLGLRTFSQGLLSVASVLVGLLVGYAIVYLMGEISFDPIEQASVFAFPQPLHFGLEFSAGAVLGFCLTSVVSVIDTVGCVNGITRCGARREPTDSEIRGATYADGIGTMLGGFFGALPNTSYSQNVGLIAITGVMSRHVVTIGAVVLIFCGLVPKLGAVISTIPNEVLGGAVIVMFGMVAAAGVSILSDVEWNQRNMLILAVAVGLGFGIQLRPDAIAQMPSSFEVLFASGILPATFLAIILNQVIPETLE